MTSAAITNRKTAPKAIVLRFSWRSLAAGEHGHSLSLAPMPRRFSLLIVISQESGCGTKPVGNAQSSNGSPENWRLLNTQAIGEDEDSWTTASREGCGLEILLPNDFFFPNIALFSHQGFWTEQEVQTHLTQFLCPLITTHLLVDSQPGPASRPSRIPLQSAWLCKHLCSKPYRHLGVYTGVALLLGCIVILLCRDDGGGDVVMW